ncbi:MAG: hypothetical protein QGF33_07430, partial [Alphaproteobacteria bacterium]|nr:hypothetical protein [Alphaproteobacteria bacterium]
VEEKIDPFANAPLMISMSPLVARKEVAPDSPPVGSKVAAGSLMRVAVRNPSRYPIANEPRGALGRSLPGAAWTYSLPQPSTSTSSACAAHASAPATAAARASAPALVIAAPADVAGFGQLLVNEFGELAKIVANLDARDAQISKVEDREYILGQVAALDGGLGAVTACVCEAMGGWLVAQGRAELARLPAAEWAASTRAHYDSVNLLDKLRAEWDAFEGPTPTPSPTPPTPSTRRPSMARSVLITSPLVTSRAILS